MAIQVKLLADVPEVLEEQRFPRFSAMAQRLAELLPQLPASSPVLLSGDWGSGKTTILRAVEARLAGPRVFFEAWRYEGELPLLPALIRAVYLATPQAYRDGKAGEKAREDLRRRLWQATVSLCAGAGGGLAGVVLGPLGQSAMAGLLEVWKRDQAGQGATKGVPEEDATAALCKSLTELVEQAWKPQGGGTMPGPLCVLIDDLDRCCPSGAVALLDSLRMLVSIGQEELPCRFLVALDRGVLAQAVAKKFAEVSQFEGNRYLEKIFPVSFDVPRSDAQGLQLLLAQLDEGIRASVHPPKSAKLLSQSWQEVLNQALNEPIFANPRLAKRCINRFLLLKRFELGNAEEKDLEKEWTEESMRQDVLLVRWLAATERWPKLRRLLASRTEDNWRGAGNALRAGTSLSDAEVGALLLEQDAQVWMDRWFFAQEHYARAYRQIEERLRRQGL